MIIKKLSIENIRRHEKYTIEFQPTTTIITGKNGSGKTSLLEALAIALRGTSFRGTDKEVLRHNTPWWRIELLASDSHRRVASFEPGKQSGKKQFLIDDRKNYRLLPKDHYPIVLFEPDDLRLLYGSPERRRHFIDTLLSQLDPIYGATLRKYQRILKQRNNLLKRGLFAPNDLFAWNVGLSEHGSYIVRRRQEIIEKINTLIQEQYRDIAEVDDELAIQYSYTRDVSPQTLLHDLQQSLERDRIVGSTSVGSHRHDVLFFLNNSPALSVASRGEARTIVLAMKFIEVKLIEALVGKKPIILLDDVFSELDETRQAALSNLSLEYQVVITSTHHAADSLSIDY